jgi:hypothetical protein
MPKYILYADRCIKDSIQNGVLKIEDDGELEGGTAPHFYIIQPGDLPLETSFLHEEYQTNMDIDLFFLRYKSPGIPDFVGLNVLGGVGFTKRVYSTKLVLSHDLLRSDDIYKQYMSTGFNPETLSSIAPEVFEAVEKLLGRKGVKPRHIRCLGSPNRELFWVGGYPTAGAQELWLNSSHSHDFKVKGSVQCLQECRFHGKSLFYIHVDPDHHHNSDRIYFCLTPEGQQKYDQHKQKRKQESNKAATQSEILASLTMYPQSLISFGWPGGFVGFIMHIGGPKGLKEFVSTVEIDLFSDLVLKFELPSYVSLPSYFTDRHPDLSTDEKKELLDSLKKKESFINKIADTYCGKASRHPVLAPYRSELAECGTILKQRIKEALDEFELPDTVTGTSGVHEQISPEVVRKKSTRSY